jgi:purine nucleosidase
LKKFIIDADTGSDDAVAILLALQDPSVEVLGISVVSGNVPLKQGIKNTISTADIANKKVKIYAGAKKPLKRGFKEIHELENFLKHVKSLDSSSASGQCVHGVDGMGDIGVIPSTEDYEEKDAIDFIVDTVNNHPNEITLVTLGPLSNIALAIQKDTSISDKILHCYVMGGTSDGTGNVSAAAEYNIWVDPEAAKICFESGMNITMVGWDNSYKYAMLKEEEIKTLRALNSKLANFSIDIQKTLIDLTFESYGFFGFDLPDPITMAIALDDSIIEESEQLHVIVDTRDGITRGQTIVDYFDVEEKQQNIRVVKKSSKEKFLSLLGELLK